MVNCIIYFCFINDFGCNVVAAAARYSHRLFPCQCIEWRTGSATPVIHNADAQDLSHGQVGGVARPGNAERDNKSTLSGVRRRFATTTKVAGQELSNSKNASDFLAIQLPKLVDGRSLKQQGQTPHLKCLGDLWVRPPLGGGG